MGNSIPDLTIRQFMALIFVDRIGGKARLSDMISAFGKFEKADNKRMILDRLTTLCSRRYLVCENGCYSMTKMGSKLLNDSQKFFQLLFDF